MLSLNQIIANVSSFIVRLLNGLEYIIITSNKFVEFHINNIPQYQVFVKPSDRNYEKFNKLLQDICRGVYEIIMLVLFGLLYMVLLLIYIKLNGNNEIVVKKRKTYYIIFSLEEFEEVTDKKSTK
jgi:hypothetical protein